MEEGNAPSALLLTSAPQSPSHWPGSSVCSNLGISDPLHAKCSLWVWWRPGVAHILVLSSVISVSASLPAAFSLQVQPLTELIQVPTGT